MEENSRPSKVVLCVSSKYEQKFYWNPVFNGFPDQIKNEIKAMCVLFTEDIGGIFQLEFDEEGSLNMITSAYDEDLLYDEIGCELKIKQLREEKKDLFRSLEMFYRAFYMNSNGKA